MTQMAVARRDALKILSNLQIDALARYSDNDYSTSQFSMFSFAYELGIETKMDK